MIAFFRANISEVTSNSQFERLGLLCAGGVQCALEHCFRLFYGVCRTHVPQGQRFQPIQFGFEYLFAIDVDDRQPTIEEVHRYFVLSPQLEYRTQKNIKRCNAELIARPRYSSI